MTKPDRLDTLKKFILENMPNDRTRHCLLEIVAAVQEQKQPDIIGETPRKKVARYGTKENLS